MPANLSGTAITITAAEGETGLLFSILLYKPNELFQAQEIYLKRSLEYLKAIAQFNKAQYSLYVALGNNL